MRHSQSPLSETVEIWQALRGELCIVLRRIFAALVVLGLLAHAQLYAAHQAMALAASLGDGGAGWLCLSEDGKVSPASLKALAELKRALGQPASSADPTNHMSPCPVCFGLANAIVLPDAAGMVAPSSFSAPPPAPPVFQASCDAARFLMPPGCGPPSPSA